jgi:tetratricopeptide (TPR) repeat protein
LLIGQDGWHDGWIGAIDDVRIYNHGLYEEEVRQLYGNGGESSIPPMLLSLTDELHKARSIAEKDGPQQTIIFLEKKITEHELWNEENTDEVEVREELLSSEFHFLLAKAKEAAKAPANDIAAAYRRSISRQFFRRNYVPALLWLFKNTPASDYVGTVKESVRNSSCARNNLQHIAKDFETSKDWAAFELFLDALFDEADQPVSCAKAVVEGLKRNGSWADNFGGYAESAPQLAPYVIATCEEHAQEKMAQNEFLRAAEIYHSIVSLCGSEKDKAAYELKVLECILCNGEYRRVLSDLSRFTEGNGLHDKVLVREAILLKAHAHMHLNEIDCAKAVFSELAADRANIGQAQEADFFIGYCNMVQGKYEEATRTLSRVIEDCPESSWANKARLCLARIKRLME